MKDVLGWIVLIAAVQVVIYLFFAFVLLDWTWVAQGSSQPGRLVMAIACVG